MSELHPHLAELARALVDEQRWQQQEHDAVRRLPPEQQVERGFAWMPLRVETVESVSGRRSLIRFRANKESVLHDGISAGDPVSVGAVGTVPAVDGIALGAEGKVAEVLVEGLFDDERPQWVVKRFDPTTFSRYRAALQTAQQRVSPLRDVLLGLRAPSEPDAHGIPPIRGALNDAQRHAAEIAIRAPELALIHGPPGTGKTAVITELFRALVNKGERPLGLADSNAATDHLALRAAQAGLDVVRIGHIARMSAHVYPLSLERRIADGPHSRVLRDLQRELTRLANDDSPGAHRERRVLFEEKDTVENQARTAALESADVICSTLGTLAKLGSELPPTQTAIVDEATQAIEPAIWAVVPLVERLILVGDPHQLGPVVLEPHNRLERSLLDRLVKNVDRTSLPIPMLRVQHRMHQRIADLVNPIYQLQLEAHSSVKNHLLCDLPGVHSSSLTERPVVFVDTAGAGFEEQRDPVTLSWFNPGEIEVIAKAAAALQEAGVARSDIGVIAPYSAQVARLQARPELAGIEVATVNRFQGREKEAILCSFVRSNDDGDLGFVADVRRLTVALSRARRFLLCTGDSITLSRDRIFEHFQSCLEGTDAWETVWQPPWTL